MSSSTLSGYMVYYGSSAGNYTSKIDVGNITTSSVPNLTDGATYHFAVTAYDASHVESAYSNDVTATVPAAATAPVANFTASATSGVAPLAMNFTSTSTGTISSYAWTFGDGGTSTAQNPSHTYSSAGSFTVGLTVTGSAGSNTKTVANYINVTAPADTSPPTVPGTLVASAGGSTSINLTWGASTDNIGVTGYRIERCQGSGCTSFAQIATSTGTTFGDTGLAAGTTYSYRVRANDAAGNLSAYSNTATATTTSAATAPVAGFSGTPTSGTAPLTVNFTSTSTGTISTYAWNFGDGTTSSSQNPSHTYSAAGAYTVTLTVSGSAGSNTKTSASYISVTSPATGGALSGSMTASSTSVNLTSAGTSDWAAWPSYVHDASGGSQVSNVAMVGGASSKTYSNDPRTMTWTNGTPTASASSTAGIAVGGKGKGIQFTVPADTTTRTLTVYLGAQSTTGTLKAHLSDASAADYVVSLSAYKSRRDAVVTLQYNAQSAGQTLTVTWTANSTGNVSLQGAALVGATATTPPPSTSSCPCSLWSSSAVPTVAADSDTSAVEVGVKFTSDVAGYITGIRFYKSSTNTGTHVGSLWSANGTLLAQATFTNETASGWQQVTFSSPVAITANTVYVASYHTNVGQYADDTGFFATALDNPPLHALQDGASGGNGVYVYRGSSAFPTQTWYSSNYWVDVIFTN